MIVYSNIRFAIAIVKCISFFNPTKLQRFVYRVSVTTASSSKLIEGTECGSRLPPAAICFLWTVTVGLHKASALSSLVLPQLPVIYRVCLRNSLDSLGDAYTNAQ